jgi:hypothetical protein
MSTSKETKLEINDPRVEHSNGRPQCSLIFDKSSASVSMRNAHVVVTKSSMQLQLFQSYSLRGATYRPVGQDTLHNSLIVIYKNLYFFFAKWWQHKPNMNTISRKRKTTYQNITYSQNCTNFYCSTVGRPHVLLLFTILTSKAHPSVCEHIKLKLAPDTLKMWETDEAEHSV